MPPITLNQFTRLADQVSESRLDSHVLKVKDGKLSEGGFFTSQAARRQAIEAFVAALRKEYGNHVADMIQNTVVSGMLESGKPLTARLVKDLIHLAEAEKTRVNAHNFKVVEDFLSGRNPEKSLDRAVDALCAKNGISAPEDKAEIRERVRAHLAAKADLGGFHPNILTSDALLTGIGKGSSVHTGFTMCKSLAVSSGSLPGRLPDRLHLTDLGLGGQSAVAFERCVPKLDLMRQLQPEGDLRLETVHRALFGEDPPAGLSGDKLLQAIETRCEKDMSDLLGSVGREREPSVLLTAMWAPWETIASLMERPRTLTLDDVPGFRTYFQSRHTRSEAEHGLRVDPNRLGETQRQDLPPPTFTFQLDDGQGGLRTESVQVGNRTDFPFTDEDDKTAYLGGNDSSLARRLEALCGEICGPDATEAQALSVMRCLGQSALIPLKLVSGLAGTGFDEHSNVSVSLSRLPDGTIRADFSSPAEQEFRDSMGHFSMSLHIARDGTMTVTEFQITPPAAVLQERNREARVARINDALARAEIFRDLDPGNPSGLLFAARYRALQMNPEARVTPDVLRGLNTEIGRRIQRAAEESMAPLTESQIRDIRDAVLDEHFARLAQVAAQVPEARRPAFVRGCLELGVIPDAALIPAMLQLSGAAATAFKEVLVAKSGREAADMLADLHGVMRAATILNPDFAGQDAAHFLPAQLLAIHMGLGDLMGRSPDAFARALTRPGPFRDMLHALVQAPQGDHRAQDALQVFHWFKGAMTGSMSEDTLMVRLNPYSIRERDLSLPRQREILGQGYVVRGAGVAVPELAGLNQRLGREMPAVQARIQTQADEDLRLGPVGQGGIRARTDQGLSRTFSLDYARDGVFVNGRFYHPSPEQGTGSSEQDFIGLFPDARTAGLLSNLAGQNLQGFFIGAMGEMMPEFLEQTLFSRAMLVGRPRHEQHARIDALDAGQGRYRLTGFHAVAADDSASGVERFLYEVAIDVNLGAPGADPLPEPRVESVRVDVLIRGREAVPGEEL